MNTQENKYKKNCISCIPVQKEIERVIFTTKYGKIVLRLDDQGPIGRCIYVPFDHISHLEDMSDEIFLEAKQCAIKIYKCLQSLYGANKYAFCMIGNLTKDENNNITDNPLYEHRHFHIIPSYKNVVHRYGQSFYDDNYGKPLNLDPARGYKKMPVSIDTIINIRDDMRKWLLENKEIDKSNIL